jgi:thymidine kinase
MITLIFGPMFSGKTTYLLSYERRFLIAKKQVLIIKWSNDTRYSENSIVTHDGQSNSQQCYVLNVNLLNEIPSKLMEKYDCILIDEGQFFPDLRQFCTQFCKLSSDKHIVIAGLSGDYKQECFESIAAVLSIADTIIHVKSICSQCGNDAPFTARLSAEQEQTVIGSSDKYQPRCRKCFTL